MIMTSLNFNPVFLFILLGIGGGGGGGGALQLGKIMREMPKFRESRGVQFFK